MSQETSEQKSLRLENEVKYLYDQYHKSMKAYRQKIHEKFMELLKKEPSSQTQERICSRSAFVLYNTTAFVTYKFPCADSDFDALHKAIEVARKAYLDKRDEYNNSKVC
jgi:hypothetical protein